MATDTSMNIAAPDRSPGLGSAADSFTWKPDAPNMHVIRPKSAKGRTRPRLHRAQGAGVCSTRVPASPPSAPPRESSGSWTSGACTPSSPPRGIPHDVPGLQVPTVGSCCSLNRYPVLPSIHRKALEEGTVETAVRRAGSLRPGSVQGQALCQEETGTTEKMGGRDPGAAGGCSPGGRNPSAPRQSCWGAGELEEPSEQEPRLLLAVRSPSGRRFVRHFRPTDTLQTVVAVAEFKNKTSYLHCSLQTMEVPRRCFSDLTRSLQECGIPHKSVLGISGHHGEGWP
ncbi:UBX domain-containing protein 10 [Erinaceus europaeus]|uniref:UBX domain-containing protein 10 n=1 Tax=Erinaceus europaeus TaxID=9365 RepID=A0A1S3AGX7_ERIEU|nr:UBX domain-containing protein 10 [Erinaceus europaeus]